MASVAIALGGSGVALADDGSMNILTGESYAFFNGIAHEPGTFNLMSPARPHSVASATVRSPSVPAVTSTAPAEEPITP